MDDVSGILTTLAANALGISPFLALGSVYEARMHTLSSLAHADKAGEFLPEDTAYGIWKRTRGRHWVDGYWAKYLESNLELIAYDAVQAVLYTALGIKNDDMGDLPTSVGALVCDAVASGAYGVLAGAAQTFQRRLFVRDIDADDEYARYSSALATIRDDEGFASFFNDASPTMMMGGWSMFMIKALSPRLVRSAFDRTTDLRFESRLLVAYEIFFIAVMETLVYPMELVAMRIAVQEPIEQGSIVPFVRTGRRKYMNFGDGLRSIVREEGLGGLYQGFGWSFAPARLLFSLVTIGLDLRLNGFPKLAF